MWSPHGVVNQLSFLSQPVPFPPSPVKESQQCSLALFHSGLCMLNSCFTVLCLLRLWPGRLLHGRSFATMSPVVQTCQKSTKPHYLIHLCLCKVKLTAFLVFITFLLVCECCMIVQVPGFFLAFNLLLVVQDQPRVSFPNKLT